VVDRGGRQDVVRTSVTHSAIALCGTFLLLPHFGVICDLLLNRRTATLNLFVLYDNETNYTDKAFFYFKIFQHNSKAGLCPLWRTQKTPFDVIYCLYKMKQFHWLLCVAKNCD